MIGSALEEVMRTDSADALCRLLRDIYYAEEGSGSATVDNPDLQAALAMAGDLGLIKRRAPGRYNLTACGYEIGNFAKEYCNWVDSGRRAPEGVSPEVIVGRRLLDVGCSFGRHLTTFRRMGARAVGIELEENYLQLSQLFAAREHLPRPPMARATAIHLPFGNRTFDVVFCRLVINYLPVRAALAEFARVLAPGGRLIISFLTFRDGAAFLRRARWRGNVRTVAWHTFGLVNTLTLQLTGCQMSVRAQGRMSSQHTPTWPTPAWLGRELTRQGFAAPAGGYQVHDAPVVLHALRTTGLPPA